MSSTLLFILIIASSLCSAQDQRNSDSYRFDFNERCTEAYIEIFRLRLDAGKALLLEEKNENPRNRAPWLIENYIDFLSIYIGEDFEQFERLERNKDIRLEAVRKAPKDSPWYRYSQAEIHLQWAFARLKFEQYFNAFREVRKAFVLLEENQEKFPDFKPQYKSLGMLHAIVGAIPDQYKWGVKLVGLEGSINQGMRELEELLAWAAEEDFIFEQEAWVFYTLMSLYLQNDAEAAWEPVAKANLELDGHLLNNFVAASVAMRTGRNDYAVELLMTRPRDESYLPFPFLDYMLGLAKLRRLDPDANTYLQRFVDEFGGRHYIREAYQKLAWYELTQSNSDGYKEGMRNCLRYGHSVIDDDIQAEAEARRNEEPHPVLLRSRLLFDGGYYKRALAELEGREADDFERVKDQVEFAYRAGRIYHEAGKPDKAKGFYYETLRRGEDLPYFFAANAALQLGEIFESEGNMDKAEHYFRRCIKMKDHEYENSLQAKAKAGLNRIED